MSKSKKKGVKVALIGSAAAGLAYLAAGEAFYEVFLTRKAVHKREKPHLPSQAEIERCKALEKYESPSEWYAAHDDNDIEMITLRGETIHAKLFTHDEPSHTYVICIHGYTSSPYRMASPAYHFYERGYNVLMPYLGGHGLSEKKTVSMGYHDRLNIVDWIDYIITFDRQAEIILYGVSMGAATTLLTTGEKLPENVKCAISDCGFTSAWEEFYLQCTNVAHLPPFRFCMPFAESQFSGISSTRRSARPTVCSKVRYPHAVHTRQQGCVRTLLDARYTLRQRSLRKQKLVIEGAEHANSDDVNPSFTGAPSLTSSTSILPRLLRRTT